MMQFKEFLKQFENLWGEIPGNPAFGGKKPSDGRGRNPNNINQSDNSGAPSNIPPGARMMKKKMKKD